METIINIGYMIIGIGLMILTISVGLIGFIKLWREINKIGDTKEQMEYTNTINPLEFTMSCIVLIGYISGKVWMYYKGEQTKENETNSK